MTSANTVKASDQMTNLTPFPAPQPDWSQDDPAHSGFGVNGLDNTPGNKAYFIHLEAKPGKEELLKEFLHDINNGVDREPMTGPWFGLRYSQSIFCIFEAFPDVAGRHAHDNGPGGHNFLRSALLRDMLAYPAQVYRMDVLHGKYGVMLGKQVKAA